MGRSFCLIEAFFEEEWNAFDNAHNIQRQADCFPTRWEPLYSPPFESIQGEWYHAGGMGKKQHNKKRVSSLAQIPASCCCLYFQLENCIEERYHSLHEEGSSQYLFPMRI